MRDNDLEYLNLLGQATNERNSQRMSSVALKAKSLTHIADIEALHAGLRSRMRYAELGGTIQPEEYAEFSAMCLSVIDRMTSRHDAYYEQALREMERRDLGSESLADALFGMVKSLKRDIEADTLTTLVEQAHGEILAELLATAEELLNQKRKDPAAVLIGGVLETHLRILATKFDVPVSESNDEGQALVRSPEQINDALAQGVYARLDHQNVAGWLTLRRKALQGASTAFSRDQVVLFLQGLRVSWHGTRPDHDRDLVSLAR